MSDDMFYGICDRHEADAQTVKYLFLDTEQGEQAHRDRGWLLDEVSRLRAALNSIARNTCCGGCQEAARVAREAMEVKP